MGGIGCHRRHGHVPGIEQGGDRRLLSQIVLEPGAAHHRAAQGRTGVLRGEIHGQAASGGLEQVAPGLRVVGAVHGGVDLRRQLLLRQGVGQPGPGGLPLGAGVLPFKEPGRHAGARAGAGGGGQLVRPVPVVVVQGQAGKHDLRAGVVGQIGEIGQAAVPLHQQAVQTGLLRVQAVEGRAPVGQGPQQAHGGVEPLLRAHRQLAQTVILGLRQLQDLPGLPGVPAEQDGALRLAAPVARHHGQHAGAAGVHPAQLPALVGQGEGDPFPGGPAVGGAEHGCAVEVAEAEESDLVGHKTGAGGKPVYRFRLRHHGGPPRLRPGAAPVVGAVDVGVRVAHPPADGEHKPAVETVHHPAGAGQQAHQVGGLIPARQILVGPLGGHGDQGVQVRPLRVAGEADAQVFRVPLRLGLVGINRKVIVLVASVLPGVGQGVVLFLCRGITGLGDPHHAIRKVSEGQ